jgi:hypothetical protein
MERVTRRRSVITENANQVVVTIGDDLRYHVRQVMLGVPFQPDLVDRQRSDRVNALWDASRVQNQ